MWDNIQGGFLDHLEQIDADLKAAGLPALGLDTAPKIEVVEVKERVAEETGAIGGEVVIVTGEK